MKLKRNLRTTLQKFVKDPGSTFKFMSRFSDSMEQEFFKVISSFMESATSYENRSPLDVDNIPDLRSLQKLQAFKGAESCKYQSIVEAAALKMKMWAVKTEKKKGKVQHLQFLGEKVT